MKIVLIAVISFFSLFAMAHEGQEHSGGHTENVCSVDDAQVCAHLRFDSELNSTDEGKFVAHVLVPDNSQVNNFKLDLWMEMGHHGHGSAPVEILAMDEVNHYAISNAWFVMMGQWLVRVDFDYNGKSYHLEIPVNIKK